MDIKSLRLYSLLLIFAFSVSAITISCEGPEGPMGPEGPAGEAGPEGPAGEDGNDGEPGTAEVIYSTWIDNSWEKLGNGFVVDDIDAPKLTEEIKEEGVILVFHRDASDSEFVKALPSHVYHNNEVIFTIEFSAFVGKINLIHGPSAHPEGKGMEELLPGSQARYILIPGGEPAKLSPGFYEDYHAVLEYFGIPE